MSYHAINGGEWFQVGAIPSDYIPSEVVRVPAYGSSGKSGGIQIDTDGAIKINSTGRDSYCAAMTWVY